MSINFANVKNIVIPEGSVKSITSGGVTLWGTPYKKLDYIQFSGTEYILLDYKPTNNRLYSLEFDIAAKTNDRFILAAGGDYDESTGSMRCTVRTSASYFQRRYGRNSSTNTNIGTTCVINTKYTLQFRIYNDFTAAFAILSGSTQVGSSTESTAQTFTPANMNTFAIMGYGQGDYASNLSQGKVYRFYIRSTSADTGSLLCDMYPVQRKSDNVCGLYDIINQKFYPMAGTNITSAAAGTVTSADFDGFEYRKLEYIRFSGAETLNTTIKPQQDKYYFTQVKFRGASSNVNTGYAVMASHATSSGDRSVGIGMMGTSTYKPAYLYATSDIWTSLDSTYLDFTHKYEARWRIYDNSYTHWICLRDLTTSTDYGQYMNSSSSAVSFTSLGTIRLMNDTTSYFTKGDVYRFYVREDGDVNILEYDMYPVQRKSDNVCGLYDELHDKFYPMTGTSITSGAKGTVVQENYR